MVCVIVWPRARGVSCSNFLASIVVVLSKQGFSMQCSRITLRVIYKVYFRTRDRRDPKMQASSIIHRRANRSCKIRLALTMAKTLPTCKLQTSSNVLPLCWCMNSDMAGTCLRPYVSEASSVRLQIRLSHTKGPSTNIMGMFRFCIGNYKHGLRHLVHV